MERADGIWRTWARSLGAAAGGLGLRLAIAGVGMWPIERTRPAAGALGRLYARWHHRHRARARANIAAAFPDWDSARVAWCVEACHEHLLALGAEMLVLPRLLNDAAWPVHVRLSDVAPGLRALMVNRPCILITGHCGHWELLGYTLALLGFPVHALYRPLDLAWLDRWVRRTRQGRGLVLVDKFGALRRLPGILAAGNPVGFVADQSGGDRGVFVPFFNRLTSTYKSIGLLALQFGATVVCGWARREEPLHSPRLGYVLELTDVFGPAEWSQHPDPLFYLTARYRRALEHMIRQAPGQYLWMHRIWRARPRHERLGQPVPASLREKLRLLPWIADADMAQILENSERDARALASGDRRRLP